jgi:hypothetical protein
MFKNEVILRVGGEPWTIGAVCLVVALVCFVVWIALLPSMARRMGSVRQMSSAEAARFTYAGTDTSYVKPRPQLAGPAAGRQWSVNMSIGDLRTAWRQKHYGLFFGAPLYVCLLPVAFALGGLALAFFMERTMPGLLFSVLPVLLVAMNGFMMWAAVFTRLE